MIIKTAFRKKERSRMKTQITARHFDASSALKEHVQKRLAKLERFYDGYTDAHVIMSEGDDPSAGKEVEINLNVRQQRLSAEGAASTYEKAVSDCAERLRRQVIKHKEKMRSNDQNRYR
jgi:putative sigma-54 modulation protein